MFPLTGRQSDTKGARLKENNSFNVCSVINSGLGLIQISLSVLSFCYTVVVLQLKKNNNNCTLLIRILSVSPHIVVYLRFYTILYSKYVPVLCFCFNNDVYMSPRERKPRLPQIHSCTKAVCSRVVLPFQISDC